MELYLTGLWQDLLRLDSIGIKDDFFELGGNSLLAIQMMVRIEKEKGKQLPLVSVFEYGISFIFFFHSPTGYFVFKSIKNKI